MEEDLKILEMWYLRNRLLYLPQILNWRYGHISETENYLKFRLPPIEDDLKMSKMEYLSNYKVEDSLKWKTTLNKLD